MQHKDFATKEEELKVMRFYQNDLNSAKLLINVTHDKVVTDFSTATKVQIAFLKPDGKRVFQDVQNVNQMQGKYYVVLSTQTLIAYGNVVAQLRLTFPDNKVIETCKFVFAVDESIMSDEAMKSTNEFPVIQKAIEAGEKLEGVDINGIIAAGVKADTALPKTGGTMSGNVDMDISVGSKSKGYRWRDATGALFGLESATDGALILYDYKNLARVWQYDPVAKRFTVLSDTNLLKTTGGTITGTTIFEAGDLRFKNTANDILFRNNTSGIFSFYDIAQNQVVWSYNPATKEFTVNSASNLLKKTGDTLTGTLNFDVKSGASKAVRGIIDGQVQSGLLLEQSGFQAYDWKNNKQVFQYLEATNTFNVTAPNTNLVTKTKDSQVDLVVTANGEAFDTGTPNVARRRGNTVTIRIALKRKAGSTDNIVATIPPEMRPSTFMVTNALATDGTVVRVTVEAAGNIKFSATDKSVYDTITYVVD
ncbi:BppU family phage baseplate upper protein [Bacillus cereus group sp. Bc222]|nr:MULTISPECIES: BppU family phage baseplate upper protein [Bacillus]MDA2013090.1 BppU family phage baseplate upper protein [Bacillus cereus group sp. Bcc09]MDA2242051.1 BppU family phage baseplate upper protein [Bacillus cereus group sp. Bc222]